MDFLILAWYDHIRQPDQELAEREQNDHLEHFDDRIDICHIPAGAQSAIHR